MLKGEFFRCDNLNDNMSETKVRIHERAAVMATPVSKPQEKAATGVCPKCGAAVDADMELCPECGWKLVDYCTFCGAPMRPDDIDCPECGMPSDGVICPECQTRNFRAFCVKCGIPLSRAARMAVEKAKKDPKVHETARLLQRMAQLHAELEEAQQEEALDEKKPRELSELEKEYQALMAKVGFKPAEAPKTTPRKTSRKIEEICEEFKQTAKDVNKVLEEMLPPAGSTPQEQRNYYTARKVAVTEIITETFWGIDPQDTMAWLCNHCQVMHENPQKCIYRDFGGKWVSNSNWKMWTVVDAGTEGAVEVHNYREKRVYKRE